MRYALYDFLVNRHPQIRKRYHECHDHAVGGAVVLSWLYLLWLNLCIHIPGYAHRSGQGAGIPYEKKQPPIEMSESKLASQEILTPDAMAAYLSQYDVISFDVFDTLLFRPFSSPTDLFHFVGEQFSFMNFKDLRIRMEWEAREECREQKGHTQICLRDIWERIEQETGIAAEEGMRAEMEQEASFCYANPYMLRVFLRLREQKKCMIAVSDMYLPTDFIKQLLEQCGFEGLKQIYVSGEAGAGKSDGALYEQVKTELPQGASVIHVGDNAWSDVKMAKQHGFVACYYPNADRKSPHYRAEEMSPVIGAAYRGVVNHHLYNGLHSYGMDYEYGYVYGGLFVLGYCSFIHCYAKRNGVDKLLFLSRDGDVLKQAYDILYQDIPTEYVYWSRTAATKLMAKYNRYDFFRRFLFHKVNQGKSITEVLQAMDLGALLGRLPDGVDASCVLDEQNAKRIKGYLEENWGQVLASYKEPQEAAGDYYAKVLKDCEKACAVDIGWAGSGAMALSHLADTEWKLPAQIVGIIAGTNTPHGEEPEAAEAFLQTGRLVAYLYSSAHNRDLWKLHDPNQNYNLYWELLLASPTRQFLGFGRNADGSVKLSFGGADTNQEGIRQIQSGILDFIRAYTHHFGGHPEMLRISGRDAYAPMLVALGQNQRYAKKIYEEFELKAAVGE